MLFTVIKALFFLQVKGVVWLAVRFSTAVARKLTKELVRLKGDNASLMLLRIAVRAQFVLDHRSR